MDTIVTQVAFGDKTIQMHFLEQADQTPTSTLEQTLVMELDDRQARMVYEIQEALVDLIDQAKVAARNPPETIDRSEGVNRFTGS